jgi:hypothetical protein
VVAEIEFCIRGQPANEFKKATELVAGSAGHPNGDIFRVVDGKIGPEFLLLLPDEIGIVIIPFTAPVEPHPNAAFVAANICDWPNGKVIPKAQELFLPANASKRLAKGTGPGHAETYVPHGESVP